MASLNVNMSASMRKFVNSRSKQLDYTTPTEYVRALIRDDQRRTEMARYGSLIQKWFVEGTLSPAEEATLPEGLLDRARRNAASMFKSTGSDASRPISSSEWSRLRKVARESAGVRAKKSA